ncbi:hypothetical protein GH714_024506 [Hevea brasiliensis]|uniref:Reverse transcriptase Ty1/copia-type domain-containing protein n=1 Tax=Hevea brasiliensis TaxID=3981 RepID=A0A6A6LV61_HEVBR|nr:hypothetical protein GH714_024506 [Hevea brasiliensis]
MKDLGAAKKILGMEITRDKSVGKLFLSQQAYVEKVLKRFNMNNAKPVTVPFAAHFKLSKDMSQKTDRRWSTCLVFPIRVLLVASCSEMDFEVFEGYYRCWSNIDRAKMSDLVIGYVDSDFVGT